MIASFFIVLGKGALEVDYAVNVIDEKFSFNVE